MKGVLDKQYASQRKVKKYLEFRYKERALASASAARRYLRTHDAIALVDLGAAEGLALLEIARLLGRGEYTGVEYDQGLIASAPKLPLNVRLVQGDVNDMPMFRDNSVDIVTALALLEHLENPTLALKECFRILRPGGLFVATAPCSRWEHIADLFGPKNAFGGDHHQSDITRGLMENFSKSAGFEFIDYRKFMWSPVAFLPYLGIAVSPKLAWQIDSLVEKIKITNWLFVNQRFVLKKPTV